MTARTVIVNTQTARALIIIIIIIIIIIVIIIIIIIILIIGKQCLLPTFTHQVKSKSEAVNFPFN